MLLVDKFQYKELNNEIDIVTCNQAFISQTSIPVNTWIQVVHKQCGNAKNYNYLNYAQWTKIYTLTLCGYKVTTDNYMYTNIIQ